MSTRVIQFKSNVSIDGACIYDDKKRIFYGIWKRGIFYAAGAPESYTYIDKAIRTVKKTLGEGSYISYDSNDYKESNE